jgi:hypothetical protein
MWTIAGGILLALVVIVALWLVLVVVVGAFALLVRWAKARPTSKMRHEPHFK